MTKKERKTAYDKIELYLNSYHEIRATIAMAVKWYNQHDIPMGVADDSKINDLWLYIKGLDRTRSTLLRGLCVGPNLTDKELLILLHTWGHLYYNSMSLLRTHIEIIRYYKSRI